MTLSALNGLEHNASFETFIRLKPGTPSRILVSNSDTAISAARLGMGLTQAPRHRFLPDLDAGTLVEVLGGFPPTPTPIFLLYPGNRQLPPRVRVFVDWLVDVVGPRLRPI